MSPAGTTRLVADVGGTNTRMAIFDPDQGELRALRIYRNHDFHRFEDVVGAWLQGLEAPAPTRACIAVAAPPGGDRVQMVNMDWSFSCRELAAAFDLEQVVWINDFVSNAYALHHLGANDCHTLRPARAAGLQDRRPADRRPTHRLAVVGPGTGLGGASVLRVEGRALAIAAEPGHMGLCPANAEEIALFQLLLAAHPGLYAELLVSGPGLLRLYRGLAAVRGEACVADTAEEVSRLALAAEDALCRAALDTFCALLGSVCGDFVLATGSYEGLYLAGGIIPGMIPFLEQSPFLQRLAAKGAMQDHLEQVPVRVITSPQPGLIGAAHAPL